ncbi:MAG: diaminopimelate epimerase [Candidatus Latescibacteria bacterium]|nr:diaminopimelate epimerase [Candidatus Latescibacterota bacterium]NIM21341.1 diaminopimelate epimerase [Candidatus Latescibacterota bacterium]NIM65522.1 diaminopimelate epimerase [Candidatus Latescibacterota bacterium]NIO01902.1 diaminopimelate epimerase [Candidatus Latescibacterota bacterium]NIO28715.1 diaminopimelate epimerase [Candidatus Latescibacterota bacterium]
MRLHFKKMNGLGNDFIMIDNLEGKLELPSDLIQHLCDRRKGIGADGLITIDPSKSSDFVMRYYNSDGGEAEMCGNGGRCAAHFAASLGLGERMGERISVRFDTLAGSLEAWIGGYTVALSMMDTKEMRLNIPLQVAQVEKIVHFIIAATRHVVAPVEDAFALTDEQVDAWGREIRHKSEFGPIGANVNFASVNPDGSLAIRTYEKGVEAETYGCGTGSISSAVVLGHLGRCQSPVEVMQRGGDLLKITFDKQPFGASGVILEGPVADNFDGSVEIEV